MTALIIVFFIALVDAVLLMMVVPFYFRTGLTVFRRTINCGQRSSPIPSSGQIEACMPDSVWPNFLLKEIDPVHIAFRERFFKSLLSYTPVMHGMLKLDSKSGVVTVTGQANWYPLAFLSFAFLSMPNGIDLSFGIVLFLIFGMIYVIQAIRFSQVASVAAGLWLPSSANGDHPSRIQDIPPEQRPRRLMGWRLEKIPTSLVVVIGVTIFMVLMHFFSAQQDPFRDLASAYQTNNDLQTKSISPESVEFTSANRKFSRYRGTMNIRLSQDGLELEPTFPDNLDKHKVVVPMADISGCSETCNGGGGWDADILIGRTVTEIAISRSREVLDWCWDNHIPMVSGKDRRNWVYTGVPLPDRSKYNEQLASRKQYEMQEKQSCLGY